MGLNRDIPKTVLTISILTTILTFSVFISAYAEQMVGTLRPGDDAPGVGKFPDKKQDTRTTNTTPQEHHSHHDSISKRLHKIDNLFQSDSNSVKADTSVLDNIPVIQPLNFTTSNGITTSSVTVPVCDGQRGGLVLTKQQDKLFHSFSTMALRKRMWYIHRCTYLIFSTIVLLALPLVVPIQHGYSQNEADATSEITVQSSSSYKDNLGYYHVVGEVKNNSTIDSMNYVKIVSTFYDDTKKVIGTDFTYADIDVLRPSEKSSFDIILNSAAQSQKVSRYKLSTSGDKTEALPASLKLSVGDSHLDNISYFHSLGEVTNQGKQKATYVKVSGAFYNSNNTVVATHFTFTDPQDLEPGQTAPFEIIVNAPTINEITFASLNVGSSQYSSINNNQTTHVIQNINSSSSSFQSPIVNSMPQYSPYQQQQQEQQQQQQQQYPYLYPPSNPSTQPSYPPYMPSQPIILSQNAYTDNIGTVHIVGEVMNQSPATAHFVKVIVTFYNAYNQVIGTDDTYTQPSDLAPGQRAPFDILVTSGSIPANQVRNYALSIDSS